MKAALTMQQRWPLFVYFTLEVPPQHGINWTVECLSQARSVLLNINHTLVSATDPDLHTALAERACNIFFAKYPILTWAQLFQHRLLCSLLSKRVDINGLGPTPTRFGLRPRSTYGLGARAKTILQVHLRNRPPYSTAVNFNTNRKSSVF